MRLQTRLARSIANPGEVCAHPAENDGQGQGVSSPSPTPAPERQSTLGIVRDILADSGISGLYRGFGLKALQCVCDDLVYFFLYQLIQVRARAAVADSDLRLLAEFAVGSITGCIQFFFTIPLETITVNVQAAKNDGRGWLESLAVAFRRTYEKNGIAGLWRGYTLSCILTCNPAINFGVFEYLKAKYQGKSRTKLLSPIRAFLFGVLAKCVAISLTYPLIRIKILSQALASRKKGDGESLFQTFSDVVRREGIMGLYSGLFVQLVRSSVAAGFMFATRERVRTTVLRALGRGKS